MPERCNARVSVDRFSTDGRVTFDASISCDHSTGVFEYRYVVETDDDDYSDTRRRDWGNTHGRSNVSIRDDLNLPAGHTLVDVDVIGSSVECTCIDAIHSLASTSSSPDEEERFLPEITIPQEIEKVLRGRRVPFQRRIGLVGPVDEIEFRNVKVKNARVVAGRISFGKIMNFPIKRTLFREWSDQNPTNKDKVLVDTTIEYTRRVELSWSLETRIKSGVEITVGFNYDDVITGEVHGATEIELTKREGEVTVNQETVTEKIYEIIPPGHWGRKILRIEEAPAGANFRARIVVDADVWGDVDMFFEGRRKFRGHLKRERRVPLSQLINDPNERVVSIAGFYEFCLQEGGSWYVRHWPT